MSRRSVLHSFDPLARAALLLVIACCGPLAACVSVDLAGKSAKAPIAHYDLGGAAAVAGAGGGIGLRSVDVVAPSWLDTPAMQYRLAYAEASRRSSFTESRWVAPPPELIQQVLRRSLSVGDAGAVAGNCRLVVDVDEFIQRFDSPQSSTAVLELRVALIGARAEAPLARRSFSIARPATGADARGGVAALGSATAEAALAISRWLGGLDAAGEGQQIARRCRAAQS